MIRWRGRKPESPDEYDQAVSDVQERVQTAIEQLRSALDDFERGVSEAGYDQDAPGARQKESPGDGGDKC